MMSASPSCRLCECPAVSGFVPASKVDNEKLANWCLNFLETDLADEVKEEDVFCYFCIWDAEQLLSHYMLEDELIKNHMTWWPKVQTGDVPCWYNSTKKNYFDGKIGSCCEPLEMKTTSGGGKEGVEKKVKSQRKKYRDIEKNVQIKCIYCQAVRMKQCIGNHMANMHKGEAIRCKDKFCKTYFLTREDRKRHHKKEHRMKNTCFYCGGKFSKEYLLAHIKKVHSKDIVRCTLARCTNKFFKSQADCDLHFQKVHAADYKLECDLCKRKFAKKNLLSEHVERMHFEKRIKCKICEKCFATEGVLKKHENYTHDTFKTCPSCRNEVKSKSFNEHIRKRQCNQCRQFFECSSNRLIHLKVCRISNLISKKEDGHMWRGLRHAIFGIKCEPCKQFFYRKDGLDKHIKRWHSSSSKDDVS